MSGPVSLRVRLRDHWLADQDYRVGLENRGRYQASLGRLCNAVPSSAWSRAYLTWNAYNRDLMASRRGILATAEQIMGAHDGM